MDSPTRHRELAAFLRSRRRRVDPRDHGLDPRRRRSPGLRREEVATLAGVSIAWYTWLEQARDINASVDVLTSIGRALSLTPGEMRYLLLLGRRGVDEPWAHDHAGTYSESQLLELTAGLMPNPASIVTPAFGYVAWNCASEWIVPGFLGHGDRESYNLVDFLFAENEVAGCVSEYGRAVVAQLRANAARFPRDPAIDELSQKLSRSNADFAELWRRHDVDPWGSSTAHPVIAVEHPEAGSLVFRQTLLTLDAHPELTLVVFLPASDYTARLLRKLPADESTRSR